MKLKASEVRFWQEVYAAYIAKGEGRTTATCGADYAVESLRKRVEVIDPRPDEGRL